MLSDHAWNGTDLRNKRHNADLRRKWSESLLQHAANLQRQAWSAIGLESEASRFVGFNSLSIPRRSLLRIEAAGVAADKPTPASVDPDHPSEPAAVEAVVCQTVSEDGAPVLYAVSPLVPGFSLHSLQFSPAAPGPEADRPLIATPTRLESPCYALSVDTRTGGLASCLFKASGTELVVPGQCRSLCQTVHFDGREHLLEDVRSEVVAVGKVLARLRITGQMDGIRVTNFVTVYAALDRVDFDLRIHRPVTSKEHRLCQVFPLVPPGATVRVATPGAVVRPRLQPDGDLLPGADPRRMAVQEFVSVATDQLAVTLAPLDAFALRLDLEPLSFECLGNDQNYREVLQDQHGATEFRVRYSLQAQASGYAEAAAFAFSRGATAPVVVARGRVANGRALPVVRLDPARALATCLKPADDAAAGGVILRVQEVAGRSGPLRIDVSGYRQALATDLLERDGPPLPLRDDCLLLNPRPHGFAAVRLMP
jgi:hypothetical protein